MEAPQDAEGVRSPQRAARSRQPVKMRRARNGAPHLRRAAYAADLAATVSSVRAACALLSAQMWAQDSDAQSPTKAPNRELLARPGRGRLPQGDLSRGLFGGRRLRLSNAGIREPNRGVNTQVFSAGVTWFF
jgi:hypothetical protein